MIVVGSITSPFVNTIDAEMLKLGYLIFPIDFLICTFPFRHTREPSLCHLCNGYVQ
jgi:hypothetical protein